MAARNYDVSLDSMLKSGKKIKRKRNSQNFKLDLTSNNPRFYQNRQQQLQKKKMNQQRQSISEISKFAKQQQRTRKNNIKDRLTLKSGNNRTMSKNNINNYNKTMVKTIHQSNSGKDLKLFTNHFDARNKLTSKSKPPVNVNRIKSRNSPKGIAKVNNMKLI